MQFARLMCLIANCHRDPKKSAFKWQDFIAVFEDQSGFDVEKAAEMLKALTLAMGGKVQDGDNR